MADVINNLAEYELPHSQEAEKAALGCALSGNKSLAAALEIIRAEDFYFDANREIFSVCTELFNESTPVDIVTVSDRLTRYDKLDAIGGIPYLTAVATSISTTENVGHYA